MYSSTKGTSKSLGWGENAMPLSMMRPVSPTHLLREGSIMNDLDRSFGSSMSISSLDSPHRPQRHRVPTSFSTSACLEDPFAAPSSGSIESCPQPQMPSTSSLTAPPSLSNAYIGASEGTPNAMEISSPAAINEPSPHKADMHVILPRSPLASSLASARKCNPSTRYSMPELAPVPAFLTCPSSPDSPDFKRPFKKRLASTRQLQDASFETDGPDRCVFYEEETKKFLQSRTTKPRLHTRTQSVRMRFSNLQQESLRWTKSYMDWPGENAESNLVPPSDTTQPVRLNADDSTASDSFLAPSQPAKSASPFGNYFFNPQSPRVNMLDAISSSPLSSPCLVAVDQTWSKPCSSFTIPSHDGRPSCLPRAPPPPPLLQVSTDPISLDEPQDMPPEQSGSPVRSSFRRSSLCMPRRTKTTTNALSAKENLPLAGSKPCVSMPSTHLVSGFGTHEMENKVLPCFPVKSDGLMRVSSQTVNELIKGRFDNCISGYQIVDCRFAYEHEGGHIAGSVNLNSVEQICQHFLTPGCGLHTSRAMPSRTQSGQPDEHGSTRKFVLIFHCEFSFKRAPSFALALRQADRSLSNDYPKCHFPDVYILEGGYAEFFRACPEMCEPRAYIPMDDPRYLHKRSSELSGFRRQFSRNRSFAYGEGMMPGTALTSFTSMRRAPSLAVPGGGVMPENPRCAPATLSSQPPSAHDTLFAKTRRSDTTTACSASQRLAAGSALERVTSLAPPDLARDLANSSYDSSFEAGTSDSPCAAACMGRTVLMDVSQNQQCPSFVNRLLKRADTTSAVTLSSL